MMKYKWILFTLIANSSHLHGMDNQLPEQVRNLIRQCVGKSGEDIRSFFDTTVWPQKAQLLELIQETNSEFTIHKGDFVAKILCCQLFFNEVTQQKKALEKSIIAEQQSKNQKLTPLQGPKKFKGTLQRYPEKYKLTWNQLPLHKSKK